MKKGDPRDHDGGPHQRPLHPADHHPGPPEQHDPEHRGDGTGGADFQRDSLR